MIDNLQFFIQIISLGILEGITEFIPVSSTAHLIFFGKCIGFYSEKGRLFEVSIQFGAVIALLIFFRLEIKTLIVGIIKLNYKQLLLFRNLIVSITPSVLMGFFFIKSIKNVFEYEFVISFSLIIGGIIILWIESNYDFNVNRKNNIYSISFKQSIFIGLLQCLALIPGVSRSGATIIGGIIIGLDRKNAAVFSFLMSIPTITGAIFYDLYCNADFISNSFLLEMSLGSLASFFSSILVINMAMEFISKNTYRIFAWYRIIFGFVLLLLLLFLS